MGAFLQIGICYNVSIFKENINRQKLIFEDIEKALSEKIDLSLYDLYEFDDQFQWQLKMDTNKEIGTQMTEMMKNTAVELNLGNHIYDRYLLNING